MAVMKIRDENGNFVDIPNIQGKSATIKVGNVTSLPSGSEPTIENVGTERDAIFDFGIPKSSGEDLVSSETIDSIVVVDSLPENEQTGVLYLVKE